MRNKKNNRKIISVILILVGIGCLVTAGIISIRNNIQSAGSEALLDEMRENAMNNVSDSDAQGEETEQSDMDGENASISGSDIDIPTEAVELKENPYRESFLENEDMAGWLYVEGTKIDYPVMWTPEDENFYLYKNFQKTEDVNGSLILDTDSCVDPITTNLIIHGHNMKSGAMFGDLTEYENEDYCKNHNIITLTTRDCMRQYEVIAVFRSRVYKKSEEVFKYYNFFRADNPEEFDDFYNNIKELSEFDTGVTASYGDRFITLSTCAYHVDRGRFVVVAKEVEVAERYQDFDN